jgi:hypothetical protein
MARIFGNFRLDGETHALLAGIGKSPQRLSRGDCTNSVEPFPSITGNHPAHQIGFGDGNALDVSGFIPGVMSGIFLQVFIWLLRAQYVALF